MTVDLLISIGLLTAATVACTVKAFLGLAAERDRLRSQRDEARRKHDALLSWVHGAWRHMQPADNATAVLPTDAGPTQPIRIPIPTPRTPVDTLTADTPLEVVS